MGDPFDTFLSHGDDVVPEENADPSVPTELLDLHVVLEDANVTPEAFKEVYGE